MQKLQLLAVMALLVLSACQTTQKESTAVNANAPAAVDYEKEKEAILKVIGEESAGFWEKDFERYAACWVQEPHVRTMGWWADGGVTVVAGWQERAKRTRAHMAASPEPNPTATKVIRKNMNMRIFKDVAWLTFDQYGEDTGDDLMDMPGLSRETRILEKHDGQWKIAYVGWLLEGSEESNSTD